MGNTAVNTHKNTAQYGPVVDSKHMRADTILLEPLAGHADSLDGVGKAFRSISLGVSVQFHMMKGIHDARDAIQIIP